MTCDSFIHMGDVNVGFTLTIQEDCVASDVSSATSKVVRFKSPTGGSVDRIATFVTDGTDGLIYYASTASDFTEAGTWKIQAIITVGSSIYNSSVESFKVMCNI